MMMTMMMKMLLMMMNLPHYYLSLSPLMYFQLLVDNELEPKTEMTMNLGVLSCLMSIVAAQYLSGSPHEHQSFVVVHVAICKNSMKFHLITFQYFNQIIPGY